MHLPTVTHTTAAAFATALLAATSLAGTISAPVAGAASEIKSAGLLNDYLRARSEAFKTWDLGGQVRLRYELKENAGSFPQRDFISEGVDNDNDYFLSRVKLHLGWQPASWLKFYGEGRDAQTYSDDRNPSSEEDTFDLYQGFVEIGELKSLQLTVGRQELIYGDQRYIGSADWLNTGRTFDAVRLHWAITDKTWVDLFAANVVIPQDSNFNESNGEDLFTGIYGSTTGLFKGVENQAYFLARNVDAGSPNAIAPSVGGPSERDVYSYGTRSKSLPGAFGGFDFTLESIAQFGEIVSNGTARDLDSFAVNLLAGYTFEKSSMKPRIGVGYDYGSGDSNPNDGDHETFEPLFPSLHPLLGMADLSGQKNISSPRASFSIKPCKGLTLSADYILFWLADDADFFYSESGAARNTNGYGRKPQHDSYVGSEIDLIAKFTIGAWADFQIGYSHFFTGDYIDQSVGSVKQNGGSTDADWFYAQVSITF